MKMESAGCRDRASTMPFTGFHWKEKSRRACRNLDQHDFCFYMTLKDLHWGEKAGTETVVMRIKFCASASVRGAGSAFVENGKTVKTGKGVPENGWIYQQPFGDSILDDYLSVRGLGGSTSLAVTGKVWSGKELYGLVKAGNMEAEEVWRRFGADVAAGLLPVLEEYRPDLLLLGGQIAKSFSWFGKELERECGKRKIRIQIETETSGRAMEGLLSQFPEKTQ